MESLSPTVSFGYRLKNQVLDLGSIVDQFGLEQGMKVADLGSGSGYFTIEMAKAVGDGGTVAAVDILDAALETVRSRASSASLENIQLIKANLEVLGSTYLSDSSQDFVLLANVLFQNDQKIGIIREAKRILRPASKLVVIDWEKRTGGLGPPDEYRTPKESILSLVKGEGFIYEKNIIVDAYHFGLMFRK